MTIEATAEPCSYCDVGPDEPCQTPTGLICDRIHISRPGEVVFVEATGPRLTDALNRHPTEIGKFMKEAGL